MNLLIVAVALVAIIGLRFFFGGGVAAQQIGWPTPPPGAQFPVPSAEQQAAQVQVDVSREGSEVALVQPSWPGSLPLIPPIPSTNLKFDLGGPTLSLRVDAGTFNELVQLRVTPRSLADVLPGVQGLIAFEIEAFDAEGDEVRAPLGRPLGVIVSIGAGSEGLLGDLVVGMVDDDDELRLNATAYKINLGALSTRIATLGTVVIVTN
jgi:hypothetical protein